MKNLRTTRVAIAGMMIAGIGLTSCQDDAEDISQADEIETEVSSTGIQADGESELESVFELVEDEMAILSESLNGGRTEQREHRILAECATVSHDEDNSQVIIDFGEENCLGKDGLYRRGIIIVDYNGRKKEPGATRTVTLENYHINDNLLTGTKAITNVTETETVPEFNVIVTGASFTNRAGTVSWNSNRTISVISGVDTPRNPFDDKISVTGTSAGTNKQGVAYTLTITEPLIRITERGCGRTFIDGRVAYENENGLTWILDYDPIGGQPCDRVGAVTIGEKTFNITLR
ncbi:MAG: hypothetical protein WBB45_10795 [Cyclobacteriaceae bacterium]